MTVKKPCIVICKVYSEWFTCGPDVYETPFNIDSCKKTKQNKKTTMSPIIELYGNQELLPNLKH